LRSWTRRVYYWEAYSHNLDRRVPDSRFLEGHGQTSQTEGNGGNKIQLVSAKIGLKPTTAPENSGRTHLKQRFCPRPNIEKTKVKGNLDPVYHLLHRHRVQDRQSECVPDTLKIKKTAAREKGL